VHWIERSSLSFVFRLFQLAGAGAATRPKIETYRITSDFDFHTPPPIIFSVRLDVAARAADDKIHTNAPENALKSHDDIRIGLSTLSSLHAPTLRRPALAADC